MSKVSILMALEAADGGCLKHVEYLATKLDPQKFDITLLVSNKRLKDAPTFQTKMSRSNINVLYLPIKRSIAPISDLSNCIKIFKLLSQTHYQIIHAHSSKAGVLVRLAAWIKGHKNIIYTPHCFYFQAFSNWRKYIYAWIEKLLALITKSIIVSNNEKKAAIEMRVCHSFKLLNINNAIEFDPENRNRSIFEIRQKFNLRNEFIVGSVGRLTKQKDWNTLIYAAKKVVSSNFDVLFLIAGEGEKRHELEKLINSLDLQSKVRLLGHVKEIHHLYAVMDIYVSSSLWDGLPYTFIEAMHHKKPIVATDHGHDEIINDNKTGYLVPPKNYHLLADKILSLAQSKIEVRNFGLNAYKLISEDKYSFERFIQKHEELYLSIGKLEA